MDQALQVGVEPSCFLGRRRDSHEKGIGLGVTSVVYEKICKNYIFKVCGFHKDTKSFA